MPLFIFLPPKNLALYVDALKRSKEVKICSYNKKELRIKEWKFLNYSVFF